MGAGPRGLGRLQHPSAPLPPLPHLISSCSHWPHKTCYEAVIKSPKHLCPLEYQPARSPSSGSKLGGSQNAVSEPQPQVSEEPTRALVPAPCRAGEASPSGSEGHPGESELVPPRARIPHDAAGSSRILLDFPMSAIPSGIPGKDGQGGSRAEEI